MRKIAFNDIVDSVAGLCIKANTELPPDVKTALEKARSSEQSPLGKDILGKCLENASIASTENMPICQDTGFAVFFVELGADAHIEGGTITDAVDHGVRQGYTEGYLRKSIVSDPLFDRENTNDNTPSVIHLDIVPGDKLRILMAPKGGGCENMSYLAMLTPADGIEGVVSFVVDCVVKSGGKPCPPTVVGVGIGGTSDRAMLLAKKALFRRPLGTTHTDTRYAELEGRILDEINASGVGPQGLGGTVTALAVHIETFPCHIASLPVAVNLNCHAARCKEVVL